MWELTSLPKGHSLIGVKWVYNEDQQRRKSGELQSKTSCKRLQAKIWCRLCRAPVARIDTIRLPTVIAAQNKWKIYQMDVKSAFLNGYLEEEVYIEQPPRYSKQGQEGKVYRLKKALYGLKQAQIA